MGTMLLWVRCHVVYCVCPECFKPMLCNSSLNQVDSTDSTRFGCFLYQNYMFIWNQINRHKTWLRWAELVDSTVSRIRILIRILIIYLSIMNDQLLLMRGINSFQGTNSYCFKMGLSQLFKNKRSFSQRPKRPIESWTIFIKWQLWGRVASHAGDVFDRDSIIKKP